jgi:hypothetical protein
MFTLDCFLFNQQNCMVIAAQLKQCDYLIAGTGPLKNMSSVLGDPYTSRGFADQIRSRRHLYPICVEELLRRAESAGGDTYFSILPELREFAHGEDLLFREHNQRQLSTTGYPLRYEPSYTKILVGIIEEAFRDNIPIDRPETHEESQARYRRPFEYGPANRPDGYNHAAEQERQRQERMAKIIDEMDSDDSDYDLYYDRCR